MSHTEQIQLVTLEWVLMIQSKLEDNPEAASKIIRDKITELRNA